MTENKISQHFLMHWHFLLPIKLVRMASSDLVVWQFAGRVSNTKRSRWAWLAADSHSFHQRWRSSNSRRCVPAATRILASFSLLPQSVAFHLGSSVLYAVAGLSLVSLPIWTLGHHHWWISFWTKIKILKIIKLRNNIDREFNVGCLTIHHHFGHFYVWFYNGK